MTPVDPAANANPAANPDAAPDLRIGIPKGSLQDATIDLFDRAGYNITVSSRSYYPQINDPTLQCIMFRAQEMSRYVEDGILDLGITGADWVAENKSDVHEVCELAFSKATSRPVRWVLCVPEESPVQHPRDLAGGIVATELVGTTRRYFGGELPDTRLSGESVEVKKIEFSWGATEVKARLVDAIVDVTETGSSIKANKLRIIDTLLTSTTRLIANHDAWADPAKRQRIEDLALLLQGAIDARTKVGLKLNAPKARLNDLLDMLPAATSPTVNDLRDPDWAAVEVIVDEKIERELVPALKRAGASAIFSYPLNKVVP